MLSWKETISKTRMIFGWLFGWRYSPNTDTM